VSELMTPHGRHRGHGHRVTAVAVVALVAVLATSSPASSATAATSPGGPLVELSGTFSVLIDDVAHTGAAGRDGHGLHGGAVDGEHEWHWMHGSHEPPGGDHAPELLGVLLDTGEGAVLLDLDELPDGFEPGDAVTVTVPEASFDASTGSGPSEEVEVVAVEPDPTGLGHSATSLASAQVRKMLVIPVRYEGEPAPRTVAAMSAVMSDVSAWMSSTSRGRISLAVEVVPHVTIPNLGCATAKASLDSHAAAVQESGRSMSEFHHVLVDLPASTGCDWAGLARTPGKESWTVEPYFDLGTIVHELGHNLGLLHSEWGQCWSGETRLVLAPRFQEADWCRYLTYVDPDSVMGLSLFAQPYSAVELEQLGWLASSEVLEATDGTFTLHHLMSPTPGPRVLHIDTPDRGRFSLEFRGSSSYAWLTTGAGVTLRYESGVTNLPRIRLDAKPSSNGTTTTSWSWGDITDASFTPASGVWSDPGGAFRMEVLSATADSATVRITDTTGPAASTRLVPLPPKRILDTRPHTAEGAIKGRVGAGSTIQVPVAGVGGVPGSGVAAVVMNLTATDPVREGYVTAWPTGSQRPNSSSLNVTRLGQTRANQVTVPVGTGGRVSMYSSGGTHLVADVAGYYEETESSTAGRFVPVPAKRIVDTRPGTSPPAPLGGTKTRPAARSTITVRTAGAGGIPASGVAAVTLNVTATDAASAGFVTAWPSGTKRPNASSLNLNERGETAPNLVTVPIGQDGNVSIYTSASVHLLADVVGYVTDSSSPLSSTGLFVPVPPLRWFDTRIAAPGMPTSSAGRTYQLAPGSELWKPLPSPGPVPTDAAAVLLNLTGTRPFNSGYVTVFPAATARPLASNLNLAGPLDTRANASVSSPGGLDGELAFYTSPGGHLITDLAGYWLR
jgi:hypothetical protein